MVNEQNCHRDQPAQRQTSLVPMVRPQGCRWRLGIVILTSHQQQPSPNTIQCWPHLLLAQSLSIGRRMIVPKIGRSRCVLSARNAKVASRLKGIGSNSNKNTSDVGIVGLRNFCDKFDHSIVIFVLPTGQQQRDQLGRWDSFANTAQRDLLLHEELGGMKHTSRTVIAVDTSQALRTIDSIVKSLLPEKCEKKKKYFAQVGNQNFLPGVGAQHMQEVIANHVKKLFDAWAERFEMPEGDSAIVLSVLGSLANITTVDMHVLDDVLI
ncbi:hypothetical protein ACHAW5_007537 [Stephanodiscus triporus]|uniref:Uncharacterized protein n=1 Tax=Stephanodiscus triporus TaxID=2934178 RepID=A0ABD3NRX9_9STRA